MTLEPSPPLRSFLCLSGRIITILAATFGFYLAFIHLQEAFSRDCREDNRRQEIALLQLRHEILDLHGRVATVAAQNDRMRKDLDRLEDFSRSLSPFQQPREEP
jgi:hypothetical protein